MSDTPILNMLAERGPLSVGCGDSSCLVKRSGAPGRSGGQHTNGGCRCFGGRGSRRMLREAAEVIDGLVVEADALRAEGARLKALLLRAATFDDDGETVCSDCGADVDSDGNLTCECYA